jgi:hypothetical protein
VSVASVLRHCLKNESTPVLRLAPTLHLALCLGSLFELVAAVQTLTRLQVSHTRRAEGLDRLAWLFGGETDWCMWRM